MKRFKKDNELTQSLLSFFEYQNIEKYLLKARADYLCSYLIKHNFASGINVAITAPDGTQLYSNSQGDIGKNGTLTSPETFYDIASVTKAITSATILRILNQHNQEQLLDVKLDDLLKIKGFGEITLRQLMTHRSGLKYKGNGPYVNTQNYTAEEFRTIILNPANYEINLKNPINYFDANIMLAVFALKKYFGINFDEQVQIMLSGVDGISLDSNQNTAYSGPKTIHDPKANYLREGDIVNKITCAGLFANQKGLLGFVQKLMNNQLGLGSLQKELFRFNQNANVDDGQNRSLGGWVSSNIMKNAKFYIYGFTGSAIIVLKNGNIVVITTNKTYNETKSPTGVFYINWLACWTKLT